jgi:hypothetical protein
MHCEGKTESLYQVSWTELEDISVTVCAHRTRCRVNFSESASLQNISNTVRRGCIT